MSHLKIIRNVVICCREKLGPYCPVPILSNFVFYLKYHLQWQGLMLCYAGPCSIESVHWCGHYLMEFLKKGYSSCTCRLSNHKSAFFPGRFLVPLPSRMPWPHFNKEVFSNGIYLKYTAIIGSICLCIIA